MRNLLRFVIIVGLVLAGWAVPPRAQAANLDETADQVYGQADFVHNGANHGGLNASGLSQPTGAVLDRQGDLFVADRANNRVLEYPAPLSTHPAATVVLGQPDFTHNGPNQGGLSANSLSAPELVALDALGNLYVADLSNNRVLEFFAPLSTMRPPAASLASRTSPTMAPTRAAWALAA